MSMNNKRSIKGYQRFTIALPDTKYLENLNNAIGI